MLELKQVWPEEHARRYRDKGYWRGETMFGFLERRAREIPDRLAVVGGDQRWTYAGLIERAERNAARFLALGLRPGDRVVVQLPNIPEFLSVVFGLFRANLIPVFALPAHRLAEISHFVERAKRVPMSSRPGMEISTSVRLPARSGRGQAVFAMSS